MMDGPRIFCKYNDKLSSDEQPQVGDIMLEIAWGFKSEFIFNGNAWINKEFL